MAVSMFIPIAVPVVWIGAMTCGLCHGRCTQCEEQKADDFFHECLLKGRDDLTAQTKFWFTPAANFTKTAFSGV
jgi:hypothetical protein